MFCLSLHIFVGQKTEDRISCRSQLMQTDYLRSEKTIECSNMSKISWGYYLFIYFFSFFKAEKLNFQLWFTYKQKPAVISSLKLLKLLSFCIQTTCSWVNSKLLEKCTFFAVGVFLCLCFLIYSLLSFLFKIYNMQKNVAQLNKENCISLFPPTPCNIIWNSH